MEVFRISDARHSKKLNASGKAARWNKDHQFVLYTGNTRSLSALESVVHFNGVVPTHSYKTMVIVLADDEKLYTKKQVKDLPANWRTLNAYAALQDIGSEWYKSEQSLILMVPSVIIPQEFNCIINTRHPDFTAKNVLLLRTEDFIWDERL